MPGGDRVVAIDEFQEVAEGVLQPFDHRVYFGAVFTLEVTIQDEFNGGEGTAMIMVVVRSEVWMQHTHSSFRICGNFLILVIIGEIHASAFDVYRDTIYMPEYKDMIIRKIYFSDLEWATKYRFFAKLFRNITGSRYRRVGMRFAVANSTP